MGRMKELDAEWRDAIEGMKFFDEPVQDMEAESLLRVIGYLVIENNSLKAMCGIPRGCPVPRVES